MSEGAAIEYLVELEMKWKDFAELTDDQKAALSIACFAVSEVNALMRAYTFAEHELTGKTAIDYGILVHSQGLLRTWSAKLFEFSEFITFRDKSNRTSDAVLLEISNRQTANFSELEKREGYSAARYLRHEATSHYLLNPVRKNLPFVSENANCNFYLHKMNGNSFYPLGDEVVFVARMNREGAHLDSKEAKTETYKNWWKWNIEATKWLHGVHFDFYKALVVPAAKGRLAQRKPYWIDRRLVGDPEEVKTPVFLRRPM